MADYSSEAQSAYDDIRAAGGLALFRKLKTGTISVPEDTTVPADPVELSHPCVVLPFNPPQSESFEARTLMVNTMRKLLVPGLGFLDVLNDGADKPWGPDDQVDFAGSTWNCVSLSALTVAPDGGVILFTVVVKK